MKIVVLGGGISTELDQLRAADDGLFGCECGDREHGDHHDQGHKQRKQTGRTKGVFHTNTSFLPYGIICGHDGMPLVKVYHILFHLSVVFV